MLSSFPQIRFGLLVGIGAGVPSSSCDIRLGDVVISQPDGRAGGVVQYDLRKARPGAITHGRKGYLNAPPELLLKALSNLQSQHEFQSPRIQEFIDTAFKRHPRLHSGYLYPGLEKDQLFSASYSHVDHAMTCTLCDVTKIIGRPP